MVAIMADIHVGMLAWITHGVMLYTRLWDAHGVLFTKDMN